LKRIPTIFLCAVLLGAVCLAQTDSRRGPNLEKLPLGYKHRVEQGIDSNVGVIYKRGIKIQYDIGQLAGMQITPQQQEWRTFKFQGRSEVDGHKLDFGIAMKSDDKIDMVITVPEVPANFFVSCKRQDQEKFKKELFLIASNYAQSLGRPDFAK
jgi:hypothetical protein